MTIEDRIDLRANLSEKAKNCFLPPPPYYAGLLIKSNLKSAMLSQKGHQAFYDLREAAGTDHVNLYIAQAEVVGNHQMEISISKQEPLQIEPTEIRGWPF